VPVIIDLSGTLPGAGDLSANPEYIFYLTETFSGAGGSSGVPHLLHRFSGGLSGSGSLSASLTQQLLFGGQVTGYGDLEDTLIRQASAAIEGTSSFETQAGLIIHVIPLPLAGVGDMHDSMPLPLSGQSIFSAFMDLVRVPRPLCPPAPVKRFRYNQTLGRGDLEIVITDTSGQPFSPVSITFTFYQVVRGGQRQQVGPMRRRPVPDQREGQPGRYYVTGTAGELGQPGEWICVWTYQRSWWTSAVQVEQAFRVEAAHVYGCGCGCERDGYRRKRGWL